MIRLLFVTASPGEVRPYERHLRCFGCDYETATSRPQALERLHAGDFDGVVAIAAGERESLVPEIVRAVRTEHPEQVVLALTPEDGAGPRRDLMETGVTTFLPSTCTPGQFVRGLMTALLAQ